MKLSTLVRNGYKRTYRDTSIGAEPPTHFQHTDLDTTNELDEDQAIYYQSQIGILHWIVELGRIDIATEVSCLASHVALPEKGHLQTGICFFINTACMVWYTKRQATVESAVSGAEFVAMKQAMEVSRGLRDKLRMMGLPIE